MLVRRAIGFDGRERWRVGGVGDHDVRPGIMEATAPDSTSPTRWVPKSKAGVVHRRDGFDQRRAFAQAQSEIVAKRREDTHANIAIGTRDERVFGAARFERCGHPQHWAEAQTEAAGVAKRRSRAAG